MLRQIWTSILLGLRTLPSRRGAMLVIIISMACAVGALLSIRSMSIGIANFVHSNGRSDRAIVISRNALNESVSSLPRADAAIIADAPGVKHDPEGRAILSAESTAPFAVVKKSDGLEVFMLVRGVGPQGFELRPEIKLTSGRMFQPGKFEAIAGVSAATQFDGLEQGARVSLPNGDWTIVGTFTSHGSAKDTQLLTDADTLMANTRTSTYRSITVMLESPSAFTAFKNALTSNPSLQVEVERETDYNERQTRGLTVLVDALAGTVGVIMGLGALFGVLNTMYSAIDNRRMEIATLRAIGFSGLAVVISVLSEALLLALGGSLIGAGAAWAAFNGNLHTFGASVITLAVTPGLFMSGVFFACFLAFIGGIFPALRAARRPLADALRAT
jgi:putative ABC transport system permease protein